MKVGGIILVVFAGLMLAGSAFFGIYSVKNSGSADRLASYSSSRRYRRLGALLSYSIQRKAARQRNYSIGLGLVGVLGLVGGIIMIKKGGKGGGDKQSSTATPAIAGVVPQPAAMQAPAAAAAPMAAGAPAPAPAPAPGQPLPPDNWYVGGDGQQQGPFALAQLQQGINQGQIDPRSHVFHAALGQWMPIANVPQLASALPPQQQG